ncbi:hypothetical protein [Xylanibacter ruminicola]|uniref:Lipoprotein n=1 Tax=Xylanibacter ruminicola TaxID=839 RepID=A0A1M6UXU7_XYLRU|nr:hypothetical protein [Xylanibacter ruminicola]SHK74087.1 hypothetical protein SAMN05216463_1118 [Xylanibacter ruminicola]
MKTTKLFFMAALALMTAACSNDDNDFENPAQQPAEAQGIPFTATISMGGDKATTRALSDNGSGLTATWIVDEEVALIHNGIIDKVTVASVSGNDATISGTITTDADGADVTVIFPYSAVDLDTKDVKADLLYAQSGGTLDDVAAKYDVRKGNGTLKVSGTASLNDDVTLTNQFAIFKFTVKNADGSATIDVKPFIVSIDTYDYIVTPATATNELFVALPAISGKEVKFTAFGAGSNIYIKSKTGISFTAGSYYQSVVKLNASSLKALIIPKGTSPLKGAKLLFYQTGDTYQQAADHIENKNGEFGWSTWAGWGESTMYYRENGGAQGDLSIDGNQQFGEDGLNNTIDPTLNFYFVGTY